MTIDILRDEIKQTDKLTTDDIDSATQIIGLYFGNLNNDKSEKVLISRPADLSEVPSNYVHQHPKISIIDDTTRGFVLGQRPAININCDGATSYVAIELEQSKQYKIILDGQVIATSAKPSEIEAILSTYGLRIDYLRKPPSFHCAEYVETRSFDIPVAISDINAKFKIKITDESGLVILNNEVQYGDTNFGAGKIYPLTGIIATSIISPGNYLISITIANIIAKNFNPNWKVEFIPMDNTSRVIDTSSYNDASYIPSDTAVLPTVHLDNGFWCINVGTNW